MSSEQDKDVLIGSLWVKSVGEGREVITGIINGKRVKLVRNKNKTDDTKPSYFVFQLRSRLEGGEF